jgi:hypothetical protein
MKKGLRKSMLAIFMLCLACTITVSMSMITGVYAQQTRQSQRQQDTGKPGVPYWHVWTDENGVSHQDRCELSDFMFESISSGAAPSYIDRLSSPGKHVVILYLPVGWVGEWHENPAPQWIVPLSGRWFVETMDGKRVEMGPGELSFGNDQNTKPDAQGRRGHRSGTVGDLPSVIMLVQVDQVPVNSRPCQLK